MKRGCTAALAWAALGVPAAAAASETTTYDYDALGRLIGVSTAGGSNDGMTAGTTCDAAGNRSGYSASGAGASGLLAPSAVATSAVETM